MALIDYMWLPVCWIRWVQVLVKH